VKEVLPMPITNTEFEKSGRETGIMLVEFLRFNFHSAYSADELVDELASKGRKVKEEEVERLLFSREYGGMVESRIIDGVPYYRYKKVRGFVPLKKSR
jgi:hypothetical protein